MSYRSTLLAVAVAVIAPSHAQAQGVVMQRSLSLGMAKTIAEAAQAECKSKGLEQDDACARAGIAKVAPLLK